MPELVATDKAATNPIQQSEIVRVASESVSFSVFLRHLLSTLHLAIALSM